MKNWLRAIILGGGLTFQSAGAVDIAQSPLFLSQDADPIVMLTMSVDHELFKKAYTDYANLDGGPLTIEDTTYRNDFEYYGYFEPDWCYDYNSANSRFEPKAKAQDYRCGSVSGDWSGNFLNWSTMTRMDIIRRVLFGGKRSTDTDSLTVLERAYLPADSHSFGKVYTGADTSEFTPYSGDISLCSTSYADDEGKDMRSGEPLLRVAKGNHRQWALKISTRGQCQYDAASPPHLSDREGDFVVRVQSCSAEPSDNPRCKSYGEDPRGWKPVGLLQEYPDNLRFGLVTGSYGGNLKGGVLRKKAALISGNADDSLDEVDPSTGKFTGNDGIISNINAFRIHNWNWSGRGNAPNYTDCNTYGITVDQVKGQSQAGRRCSLWGNPLGEIYLETLRYIAGAEKPSPAFSVDGGTVPPSGVTLVEDWDDPYSIENWCASCSVVVLSTGLNSFDGDDYGSASDISFYNPATNVTKALSTADIASFLDRIGEKEASNGFSGTYLSGGGDDNRCTPKTLSNLSDAEGICPELPAQEGSYNLAGLSFLARAVDLRPDLRTTVTSNNYEMTNVNTYAVNLAENLPSFDVEVGGNTVSMLPYCDATSTANSLNDADYWPCSFLDVEVEFIRRNNAGEVVSASYLIWWEDSQFGSDYDEDGTQRLKFCVGSECLSEDKVSYRGSEVVLKDFFACPSNNYLADSLTEEKAADGCIDTVSDNQVKVMSVVVVTGPGYDMRMGYTLTGADLTGVQGIATRRSGRTLNRVLLEEESGIPSGWSVGRNARVYTGNDSGAGTLQRPLYYAAKYGSFSETSEQAEDPIYGGTPQSADGTDGKWDSRDVFGNEGADGIPDTYFSVSNPALLEQSLTQVFESILGGTASGSAAAASSGQLTSDTVLYQARFSSIDWTGEVIAYNLKEGGAELGEQRWSTRDPGNAPEPGARRIYSYNGISGFELKESNWSSLNSAQQVALSGAAGTESAGKNRLRWLRGESVAGLRERTGWLGDIVNSDPVLAAGTHYQYQRLSDALGGDEYLDYIGGTGSYTAAKADRETVLYVGANDGMLHALNADDGKSLFSYVPSLVYGKVARMASADYGSALNGHVYSVDGPVRVDDAFVGDEWRNILVGTLGAGGRGVYVLDVTRPSLVNANNLVLFELTEEFLSDNYPEKDYAQYLGHVMGEPVLAPVNGRWKLIFGNGYGSASEQAALFVVDLEDPENKTVVIPTDESVISNGLSGLEWRLNAEGLAVAAYAGDLAGNMWKFDLSGNPSQWKVDYKLFSARDAQGNPQPITSPPVLGLNEVVGNGAVMVYFGTGQYFERGDNQAGDTVQSVYAIVDKGAAVEIPPGDKDTVLAKKQIVSQDGGVRRVSGEWKTPEGEQMQSAVEWTQKSGWYLDLVPPPPGIEQGERVISAPLLVNDRLLLATLIPSQTVCDYGGDSWFMELVGVGDRYIGESLVGEPGTSGISLDSAVLSASNLIRQGGKGYSPLSDIKGDLTFQEIEFFDGVYGRQSWRELR